MLKRTITSILIIIVMFPICVYADTWVFPITIALCSLIAAYEMLGCIGTRKYLRLAVPTCLFAAAAPLCARYLMNDALFAPVYMMAAFFFCFILLTMGVFSHGKLDAEKVLATFASVFYVISSFSALVLLADRPFGRYFVMLALFGPWVSDVFAYLTGRFLGRHKLIPSISPNKTIEGSIGGILFSALFAVLYGLGLTGVVDDVQTVNYIALAFAGAGMGIVGQIGDLIMSYFKRKFGIKDFGRLLPGHGGILDRFDSVLAVAPLALLLMGFQAYLQFFA